MSEPPDKRDGEPTPVSRWAVPDCVTLRCRRDGPLVIELAATGDEPPPAVRVIDHEGREFPLPTDKWAVALCRCGHSAAKPFCDGSHRGSGFEAADLAPQ